jgi:cob(I)alamin adenosyltransferase
MNKGLVIVHTGCGKGKTTAALGLSLRAVGQGMKVLIVQFIKSSRGTGEVKAARRLFPGLQIVPMGHGFVDLKDEKCFQAAHKKALKALRFAQNCITAGKFDVVVLDEANYAVSYGLVKEKDLIDLIESKPRKLHLVITGRDAKKKVIALADTVTEMKEIKHAYRKGVRSQKGIEF